MDGVYVKCDCLIGAFVVGLVMYVVNHNRYSKVYIHSNSSCHSSQIDDGGVPNVCFFFLLIVFGEEILLLYFIWHHYHVSRKSL